MVRACGFACMCPCECVRVCACVCALAQRTSGAYCCVGDGLIHRSQVDVGILAPRALTVNAISPLPAALYPVVLFYITSRSRSPSRSRSRSPSL